jgi:hypothetical protein
MNRIIIAITIFSAMIAASFWESYVEGPNSGNKKKYGWKIKRNGKIIITSYHFWLWWICFPIMMIILPQVVAGFSFKLTCFLWSMYWYGSIIEDFVYFLVNPYWNLKNWNSKHYDFYDWMKMGKIEIPVYYIIYFTFATILFFLSL